MLLPGASRNLPQPPSISEAEDPALSIKVSNTSVLAVACFVALCTGPAIAAEPPPQVDIRSSEGQVLVAVDQIRAYDWATHTLTLTPNGREALARRLPSNRIVSGIPFAVAVGGKAIYQGTFTTFVSSYSFSTPVVLVDGLRAAGEPAAEQLRVQLGYPTAAFFKGDDPRADRRIREALMASDKLSEPEPDHTRWIAKSLREIQTLKPGMTRDQLLKVLRAEGGLSNRTTQRFAYRECPYIKVDVTFKAVGELKDPLTRSPKDQIVKISTPFLEWSIAD